MQMSQTLSRVVVVAERPSEKYWTNAIPKSLDTGIL